MSSQLQEMFNYVLLQWPIKCMLTFHFSGNVSSVGVQHDGAIMGGGGGGGGRGAGGAVSARACWAHGTLARAAPGTRGPPGPAARRRRGGPLGSRRRRWARPALSSPQALPFRVPARWATLPLLPAGGPCTRLSYAIRWRAYFLMPWWVFVGFLYV